MTKQETFNLVAKHLLTQRARSMLRLQGSICAYRGANGMKCAIGVLIPDHLYNEGLENVPADCLPVLGILEKLGHDILLCSALQAVHDANNPVNWRAGLREVARRHGLTTEVLDTL